MKRTQIALRFKWPPNCQAHGYIFNFHSTWLLGSVWDPLPSPLPWNALLDWLRNTLPRFLLSNASFPVLFASYSFPLQPQILQKIPSFLLVILFYLLPEVLLSIALIIISNLSWHPILISFLKTQPQYILPPATWKIFFFENAHVT